MAYRVTHSWLYMPIIADAVGLMGHLFPGYQRQHLPLQWQSWVSMVQPAMASLGITAANWRALEDGPGHFSAQHQEQIIELGERMQMQEAAALGQHDVVPLSNQLHAYSSACAAAEANARGLVLHPLH
jgi:hypothetical protein